MSVAKSRILDLMKVRCRIFSNVFNPDRLRMGNKILRQRLKGPVLEAYYPRKILTFRDVQEAYPEYEMWDDYEEDRLEHIQNTKARGKGAPKKKRSAAESKKFAGRKKQPALPARPA